MVSLVRSLGDHVVNKGLDSKQGENLLSEAEHIGSELLHKAIQGFPLYGLPVWMVIGGIIVLISLLVFWNIVGKGEGSHAGREEPRRAYRRELARQMARDDAKKIIAGEDSAATKKRRKWMQW